MEDLKVAMDRDICDKVLRIEGKTDKALVAMENKVVEQRNADEERDVLEQLDNEEDVEVEDVFDEDLQETEGEKEKSAIVRILENLVYILTAS